MHRRFKLSLLAASLTALTLAAPALGAPSVAGEFAMPGASQIGSDNEIVEGPDGNMWVTTANVNGVARFTPDGTGTFFPIGGTTYGITVGPDGNLWASQEIGVARITPTDPPVITEVPIGGGCAGCRGIATGADGNIWIVGANKLVRIDPANPAVGQDVNAITTANAKGMSAGTDGLLWYADGDKVVSATPADTPVLTPYAVGGGTQDVAAGPSGQVLYVNPGANPQSVGRLTSGTSPLLTETGPTDPFGAVFGQDGAYWIARSGANDLLRVTPEGVASNLTGFAPSGGVGPRKIATGPGNTLWVTLDTPDKVAKVAGVDPPAVDPGPGTVDPGTPSDVETKIDRGPAKKIRAKGGRAKVKFAFSSSVAGAEFECALDKPKPKKKPKRAGALRPCESPKSYRLKPGKYAFRVRAVLGDLVDPTPATLKFKVKRG